MFPSSFARRAILAAGLLLLARFALPVGVAPAAAAMQGEGTGLGANLPQAATDAPAIAGRVDPDTYRVGPGDEFAFRSSDLLDPRILRVGPTGEIILPDAGSIHVAGLTIREMQERARDVLRPYIRGKGFVLVLQRPRRFRALVVGEVARPGATLVQAPARASDAIDAVGGVREGGARRGIVVRRGPDSLWVDLVRFERTGDLDANPLVFETDVIFVPPSIRSVDVMGAVVHPGRYDLVAGDRATTLLEVAGGIAPRAAGDRITVSREASPGQREEFAIGAIGSATEDPVLQTGDHLFVPEQAHWREGARVEVRGEISRPGPYGIVDGVDRLGSLFERAGGFTEWADTAAIRIERSSDVAVRDSAFLRLARDGNGLVTSDERGYVAAVARELAAVSRRPAEGNGSWSDLPLLQGDRVVVPRRSLTVMVQGEVKSPGHVPYVPGRGVGEYVRAAGGYTAHANRARVRVTLARTGRPVGAGDVGALSGGDVIWVPSREPRSFWGSVRDVLTTAAQAATIYLVVREATK